MFLDVALDGGWDGVADGLAVGDALADVGRADVEHGASNGYDGVVGGSWE